MPPPRNRVAHAGGDKPRAEFLHAEGKAAPRIANAGEPRIPVRKELAAKRLQKFGIRDVCLLQVRIEPGEIFAACGRLLAMDSDGPLAHARGLLKQSAIPRR